MTRDSRLKEIVKSLYVVAGTASALSLAPCVKVTQGWAMGVQVCAEGPTHSVHAEGRARLCVQSRVPGGPRRG